MSESQTDGLSAALSSLRIVRTPPVARARSRRGSPALGALILLVAAGAGLAVHRWRAPGVEVVLGEIYQAPASAAEADFEAVGYVVPERLARVGSSLLGKIASVHAWEGDRVWTGQTLFKLDASDQRSAVSVASTQLDAARARLDAAQAVLADIKRQYDRERGLAEAGAVPRANAEDWAGKLRSETARVRTAATEVRVKEAEAAAAQTALSHTVIPAPIDGIVLTRPPAVGDVVGPTSMLVEIANEASLRIEADVPEGRLGQLRPGAPVEVTLDALPGKRLPGSVVSTAPRLSRAKATGTVKVRLLESVPSLCPEMAARVSFLRQRPGPGGRPRRPPRAVPPLRAPDGSAHPIDLPSPAAVAAPSISWAPRSAIVERDGRKVIFVVEGGRTRAVPVIVGQQLGDKIELTEGPTPGTRVVVTPPENLKDAAQVEEKRR